MKLILCRRCQDVFKLQTTQRECGCGATWGRYDDDGLNAVYSDEFGVPIGFKNDSLRRAVRNQPSEGRGEPFVAFVIPKECPTMRKATG